MRPGWPLGYATRLLHSTAVAAAVDAAHQQFTTLPAEPIGSTLVVRLAAEITAIDRDLVELDAQLTDRFRQHEAAEILLSLPGFGPVLAATFLANIGGNLNGFDTVDRLAAVAGLAPVPYDSGRITATCTGHDGSTDGYCAPATSPHFPASRTVPHPARSTTANVEKASPTNKH